MTLAQRLLPHLPKGWEWIVCGDGNTLIYKYAFDGEPPHYELAWAESWDNSTLSNWLLDELAPNLVCLAPHEGGWEVGVHVDGDDAAWVFIRPLKTLALVEAFLAVKE